MGRVQAVSSGPVTQLAMIVAPPARDRSIIEYRAGMRTPRRNWGWVVDVLIVAGVGDEMARVSIEAVDLSSIGLVGAWRTGSLGRRAVRGNEVSPIGFQAGFLTG